MQRKIVAIMLIKNEDKFIERVIRNIAEACDHIIVADDRSQDKTMEIVTGLSRELRHVEIRRITSPAESALALEPYFGTPTWIFAVDGDEIFDPIGLKTMRQNLLQGEFDKDWCIFPNTLHCTSIDLVNYQARGYLAPPSRASARLYNFSIIKQWTQCPERLHGGNLVFKDGFNERLRRYLHTEASWEDSYFRCIHMAFLQRSSLEKNRFVKTRSNPAETMSTTSEKGRGRLLMKMIYRKFTSLLGLDWKNRKYRRGPLVRKEVG